MELARYVWGEMKVLGVESLDRRPLADAFLHLSYRDQVRELGLSAWVNGREVIPRV